MLGGKTELGAAILYRVLSDCLTKRGAFEQKPKGRRGVRLEAIGKGLSWVEETSTKAPRLEPGG